MKKRWYEHWYQLRGAPAEHTGLDVEPLSPLTIRTGRFAYRDVLVTNRAEHEQVLLTNGALASAVTDNSGTVVGLYVGPHSLARVGFAIEPHQSRPVPVLIGTASMVPDLGYAVPPGHWWLVIALATDTGVTLTAPLEITITP